MNSMKPKVIIVLRGGLIQEVLSDHDIGLATIDLDVDGVPEEDITIIKDENGNPNQACVSLFNPHPWHSPKWTRFFWKQVKNAVKGG